MPLKLFVGQFRFLTQHVLPGAGSCKTSGGWNGALLVLVLTMPVLVLAMLMSVLVQAMPVLVQAMLMPVLVQAMLMSVLVQAMPVLVLVQAMPPLVAGWATFHQCVSPAACGHKC